MAIASVAGVIWTGGFIVRGWMQTTAVALMAGTNYLQFAFFASILTLFSNVLTLRCAGVGFLLYYGSFFLRHSARLHKRELEVELFLPYLDEVRLKGMRFWWTVHAIELLPMLITIIWPSPPVLAWCCAVMTSLGYQIVLAFVYSDLFLKQRAQARS